MNGFCPAFCDGAYEACKEEYIDLELIKPTDNTAIRRKSKFHEKLPFCTRDSVKCQKLSEIADSEKEFCQIFGFRHSQANETSCLLLGAPKNDWALTHSEGIIERPLSAVIRTVTKGLRKLQKFRKCVS